MINKFKSGDKVICIDNTNAFELIPYIKSYTISHIKTIFIFLVDEESKFPYVYTRFEFDIKTMRKDKLKKIPNHEN